MSGRTKRCPHCGGQLAEEAAFCPYCARDIRIRRSVSVPLRRWLRPVKRAAILMVFLALVLVAAALYEVLTPNVYDAWGELTYTMDGNPYHLVLTFRNDTTPERSCTVKVEEGENYERTSKLFITHVETGVDAGRMFDQQIASTYVRLIQPEDSPSPVTWEQPVYQGTPAMEGLMRSYLTFTDRSLGPVEVEWTLSMKNGDTIRLHQKLSFEPVETLDFYPEDYPMDTMEDLRALVDRIEAEVPLPTVVNLYLPPVWYEGGLTLDGRPINLYGSVDEQNKRTAFLGPVAVTPENGSTSTVENVEFRGDGTGTGLTVEADGRIRNCGFYGWETGLLVGGVHWADPVGCWFEDNGVGFCFDSAGDYFNYSYFEGNTFLRNEIAVDLVRVPRAKEIDFRNCRFSDNGDNIRNLSGYPINISYATFE